MMKCFSIHNTLEFWLGCDCRITIWIWLLHVRFNMIAAWPVECNWCISGGIWSRHDRLNVLAAWRIIDAWQTICNIISKADEHILEIVKSILAWTIFLHTLASAYISAIFQLYFIFFTLFAIVSSVLFWWHKWTLWSIDCWCCSSS